MNLLHLNKKFQQEKFLGFDWTMKCQNLIINITYNNKIFHY